jgi:hypothetical protein
MPDREPQDRRSRRRRRIVLVALVVVALAVPVIANLATPDRERAPDPKDLDRLAHVDGYVKEATVRRVVVEQADGMFVNLETHPYLSSEDVAHLQDHARYGTATRIPYERRSGRRHAVAVKDLPDFPGVDRPEAREATPEALARVAKGDPAKRVARLLGPPLEVRFDHTGDRDCWRWPTPGSDTTRAEVCFTTDSRPVVLRISTVES